MPVPVVFGFVLERASPLVAWSHQVIGEILAGIVLGPSVLGRINTFTVSLFPAASLGTFGVIANLGASRQRDQCACCQWVGVFFPSPPPLWWGVRVLLGLDGPFLDPALLPARPPAVALASPVRPGFWGHTGGAVS